MCVGLYEGLWCNGVVHELISVKQNSGPEGGPDGGSDGGSGSVGRDDEQGPERRKLIEDVDDQSGSEWPDWSEVIDDEDEYITAFDDDVVNPPPTDDILPSSFTVAVDEGRPTDNGRVAIVDIYPFESGVVALGLSEVGECTAHYYRITNGSATLSYSQILSSECGQGWAPLLYSGYVSTYDCKFFVVNAKGAVLKGKIEDVQCKIYGAGVVVGQRGLWVDGTGAGRYRMVLPLSGSDAGDAVWMSSGGGGRKMNMLVPRETDGGKTLYSVDVEEVGSAKVRWSREFEDRSGHECYPLYLGGRSSPTGKNSMAKNADDRITLRGEKGARRPPEEAEDDGGVKVLMAVGRRAVMMVARTGDVEWTADLDSYPVGPPNVRPSGSGRSAVGFNGGGQVREYEVSERSKWFEGGTYRGSRDYARQEVAVDEEVKVDGSRVRISYGVWEQGGEGKEVTVACGEKIFYKGVPEGGLVEFQGWRVPGVYPCRLSLAGGGEEPDAAADFSVMYNLDLTGLELLVIIPMVLVAVSVGGYDDGRRKRREVREWVYGDGGGGGVDIGKM